MFGKDISLSFISKIFVHVLRYSFRRTYVFNIEKYSPENIIYTGKYIYWLFFQDLNKLKFLDEVHFDGRVCKIRYAR